MTNAFISASARYEAQQANLSTAGIRQLTQASLPVGAGASATYTVASPEARRVAVIFIGNLGDIRFNQGASAAATHLPIPPGELFRVTAIQGEQLSFYNTTASAITVYLIELQ